MSGSFDYYVKGGRLSFNVTKIEPVGKGLLYVKLLELKEKLLKEGLFDEEHKIPIPSFAKRICVITSKTGAVIRDIVTTVRKKNNYTDIFLIDVRVQGDGASEEIVNALKLADTLKFDAIIVARGGGSFEDLMPFNSELLARQIYATKTPVISAVGHETDFTICDWVSDLRLPTPTAAGEKIGFDVSAVVEYFKKSIKTINYVISKIYSDRQSKLFDLTKSLTNKMEITMENKLSKVKSESALIMNLIQKIFTEKEHRLEKSISVLEKINPASILKSGYFKVSLNGNNISDICELKIDDIVNIEGLDGECDAKIINVRGKRNGT